MTVGEFRKLTQGLDDDVEMVFCETCFFPGDDEIDSFHDVAEYDLESHHVRERDGKLVIGTQHVPRGF